MGTQAYSKVQNKLVNLCLERIEAEKLGLDTKEVDNEIDGLEWLLEKLNAKKLSLRLSKVS